MQTNLKASDDLVRDSSVGSSLGEDLLPLETITDLSFVQKVFNIQVFTQSTLRQRNVVWVCKEDFEAFFCANSSISEKVPPYVQVANQVYRVMIGSLQKSWMAVSDLQMEEINVSTFEGFGGPRAVVATPFDPASVKTFPLEKADIRVSEESVLLESNKKIVISADQLKDVLKRKFKPEYLVKNKTISIGFPWGEMRAEVVTLSPSNQYHKHQLAYGVIEESTELKLIPTLSNQVVVVDDIYKEEVLHFDFKLTTHKRISTASQNTFPIVLSAEEIHKHILKKLSGKLICKGYMITIPHPSGWDIQVKLTKSVIDPKALSGKKEKVIHEELEDGYVITNSSNIRLDARSSEILLTKGPTSEPDEITFKIADIPGGVSHPTIDQDKERWINIEELKEALNSREEPYALHQIFEMNLSSGTYLIEVSRVKAGEIIEKKETGDHVRSWKIGSETYLEIEAEKELEVNLIEDMKPLPLQKASFQVKGKKTPDNGLNISIAEMRELIASQAPKTIVKNQSFEIRTDCDDRLELKLIDLEFEAGIEFDKNLTAFGVVAEKTELDFTTMVLDNINVIDRVYNKEVEKLKFSLSTSKRKGVAKVARVPLVVNQDEIIEKIRKELREYKYLLEGFSITIPYGEGWDIEARFQKGVLNKQLETNAGENRFTNITSKKGFACTDETPIEFVPHMRNVVLVKGKPVAASVMNLKVIEIIENYNKENDTIVKGNWIDLEEMKKGLLELTKPLAKTERVVVDLDSGKFLLEVKNAKAEGLIDLSPKEVGRLQWIVGSDTRINLAIEKRLDLQKVKSGELHVLKKIEFTVFPENQSSEHISLKDLEIKQALSDLLPMKIIKDHVLTVDTESNHTLRLEVKEMTPKKLGKKADTSNIFGMITEDTEIVFRGKQDTNLAIRSTPKILELKDPIKYLEDLGIGGIDEQFKQIYRIFFSRSDRLGEEAARRGTKPIKGILLYGPPGTGKTTLARHIGDMLGCSGERLNMLTATEIFNMWFGGSEKNVRKMFEPAREAQEKYKKESPLYIVVIDEIDALLPKRGGSVNKVRDSLVNQFLGEMDGLNELNNLLVVGITNRKEDIDPAALRHGRFGVHVEIGLPDAKGREKIFQIHTKKLVKEKLLDEGVDLKALAEKTDKYSGAEIEGLVEEASLFSLERLNGLECSKEELKVHEKGVVTMKDFEKALEERKDDKNDIPEGVRRMYL